MALDRAALIGGLQAEFDKDKGGNLVKINENNYITETNALDCSATAIPVADLRKTKDVLVQYRDAFKKNGSKDLQVAQNILHFENAIKCVDQVISDIMKQ